MMIETNGEQGMTEDQSPAPLPDETAAVPRHTHGPWKARKYRINGNNGNAQPGSIWIDCAAFTKHGRSLAGTVAEVYANGTGSDDPAVQAANARLIAAAPDLLAACRAMIAWDDAEKAGPDYGSQTRETHPSGEAIWRTWWDSQHELCRQAFDGARAAITRATGGAL